MRSLEVILALVLAALAFIVFKITGMVLKFAFYAALAGLVTGFVVGRLLRRKA